ncbi:MAG: glycosyltransferase family 2 protein [Lachnospiraceae bacterium]|nr:glycosyltransferase family 2 protein [Lachnospiraceae bacterium]
MTDKTTIIIPNFNGIKYLKPCLASLQLPGNEARIIVVDNGSTDGSVPFLREHYPEITCICFPENKGFCEAVNTGIQASVTPYVLLLNNDTEVRQDFVAHLEERMERQPKAFSVASRMLVMQRPELLDGAGDLYCALGWAFSRYKGKVRERADKACKVFSASGGASLYRRSVMEQIGLFDTNHFAYLEDLDMGYRALIYGYENWYEPKAQVLHAGSGYSGSRYNAFKATLSSRNSIYVVYKNMPLLQIVLNLPFLIAGFVIKMIFFAQKGFATIYIKGLLRGMQSAFRTETKVHKVPFSITHVDNYCKIQWMLWINTVKRLFC